MKEKSLGVFECGYEQIELFITEGINGSFSSNPATGKLPCIKVGAHDNKRMLYHVLAVLLHEVQEWAMFRGGYRWDNSNRIRPLSQSDYLFVMTHEQFADCINKSSEFLSKAVPAITKGFQEWHKPKPKKRIKRKLTKR